MSIFNFREPMTFQPGKANEKTKVLIESQDKVLELIRTGYTPNAAMAAIGRKGDTLRIWRMRDDLFAKKLDDAVVDGQKYSFEALGLDKATVPFDKFSEMFFGQRVFPHQQSWIDLLEGREPSYVPAGVKYSPGQSNRLLINVPPEHAKSTVVTVNYSTYRIALDPNIRIIVVSKTLVKAREFVYAIKGRLSHPRYLKLQTAYGPKGGWKEDADTWRADTVYLGSDARDSSEKDPTIQALGIGGQIYGARADLIILDDVVTGANAHEWQKHIDWIQKEVITRLGKNGKLLILGTRIAANDLYRELRNNKHWSSGKSPFTYMGMPAVLSFDGKPSEWKTLWPRADQPWEGDENEEPDEEGLYVKWDGPTLHTRRGEVSPSVWALVYQQEDIAEDAIFPAELVVGSTNISRRFGPLRAGERGHPERVVGYTIIGFDPAMVGNAAFVVINYNRSDGKIYVLDCVNMTDPNPQKIRATMEALVIKYRPQELRIETNAHQKSYALDTELRQWMATYGVRLEGHNTGKIKWDVDYGVASMSGLLGSMQNEKHQKNNILEFPSVEMSEGLKALREQLIIWRPGTREKTDCVMALWFGVIRAREMQQASTRMSHYGTNRWATRAQQTQRVSVNLDEMYNEQWEQEFAEVM